jgi:hypothetical protein
MTLQGGSRGRHRIAPTSHGNDAPAVLRNLSTEVGIFPAGAALT